MSCQQPSSLQQLFLCYQLVDRLIQFLITHGNLIFVHDHGRAIVDLVRAQLLAKTIDT